VLWLIAAFLARLIMNIIAPTLRQILIELPAILVLLACIVVAVVFWQRAPLSSLCIVLINIPTVVLLIVWPVAYHAVVNMLGGGSHAAGVTNLGFRVFWSVFRAVANGLLVFAVYAGRKSSDEKLSGSLTSR
jgi:hypothetical protein